MLHCSYCDPKRREIYELKQKGLSDDQIVDSYVQKDGIATLASPPAQGFGPILTWVMPGIMLLFGFFIYSAYVKKNRKAPDALQPADQAILDRFHVQIERELDDSSPAPKK